MTDREKPRGAVAAAFNHPASSPPTAPSEIAGSDRNRHLGYVVVTYDRGRRPFAGFVYDNFSDAAEARDEMERISRTAGLNSCPGIAGLTGVADDCAQ